MSPTIPSTHSGTRTIQLGPNLTLHLASISHPAKYRHFHCRGEVSKTQQDEQSHLISAPDTPTFDFTQAPIANFIKQDRFDGVRTEGVAIDATQLLDFLKRQGTQLKKLEMVDLSIKLESADWDDDDDPYPFLARFLQLLEKLELQNLEIKRLICNASKRPHPREITHGEHKWSGTKEARVGFAGLIERFRKQRQKENLEVQEEARSSKPQSSFIENESWDDEYGFGPEEESDEEPYIHEDDGEWDM